MPDGEPIPAGQAAPRSAAGAERADAHQSAGRTARAHASRDGLRLLALLLLVVATALLARAAPFTPGSTVGYWIGVAGGVAMLLLFLYPLRKHVGFARGWGRTRVWFALHMVLGIAGPLLIVLHSTLRLGSLNATVAFVSMAVVASSGVVGRYLYARIHHGLYGRHASLAELRREAGFGSDQVHSRLGFAPAVEQRLEAFAKRAETIGREGLRRPWRFFLLGAYAWIERQRCRSELRRALSARAAEHGWTADRLRRRLRGRRRLVASYLRAVQRVAQFMVFERLFSWWHVMHVPLVYMMVVTAIVHVVAVHMY